MNQIDKIRAEMQHDLSSFEFKQGDLKESFSPNGRFKATCINLLSKDVNYPLCKIDIYQEVDSDPIFSFLCNEEHFFHTWLTANSTEYFICAEDTFGGMTVVDLTNRQMAGYSPGEDGFICVDFSLSPNGKVLASIGCYWACPYLIKVFDFTNPLLLPLAIINEIALIDNDELITGWDDNNTLVTKGIKPVYEDVKGESGERRVKLVSEAEVERRINIYQRN